MEKIFCFLVLAVCATSAATLPESRIIGGLPAGERAYPYAEIALFCLVNRINLNFTESYHAIHKAKYYKEVSIQELSQLTQYTRGHRCGGVLISPRHVLTTASCTDIHHIDGTTSVINPTEYRVFTGAVNLTNDGNPEQFRIVVNVTRHPGYTGFPMYANDIAVLTLNNPFNSTIATPLSIPHESFQPAEGAECVTVGWGSQNMTSNASVTQMFSRKVIANQQICTNLYNTEPGPNVLPSMICASPFDRPSSGCAGDFGNGLVCNGGLTGILSLITNCERNTYPEVYTRVANYTTWIRNVTAGASTIQPGLAALVLFALVQLITVKIIS